MKHALLNNGPAPRDTQKKDLGSGEALGPSSATHGLLDPSTSDNKPQRAVDQSPNAGVDQVLYGADEVAKILGICVRSVWRLVAAGELAKPVRIGRACKWFMSDVQMYLQKLRDQRDGKVRKL